MNDKRRRLIGDSGILSLSEYSKNISANSGSFTLNVLLNDNLLKSPQVEVTYSGEVISQASYDSTTGIITVNYGENYDVDNGRLGSISIAYKDQTCQCSLSQSAAVLSIVYGSRTVNASSGSNVVAEVLRINGHTFTGANASVVSNSLWITSASYNTSNGCIYLSYDTNTDKTNSRTGSITITCNGRTFTFYLIQQNDQIKSTIVKYYPRSFDSILIEGSKSTSISNTYDGSTAYVSVPASLSADGNQWTSSSSPQPIWGKQKYSTYFGYIVGDVRRYEYGLYYSGETVDISDEILEDCVMYLSTNTLNWHRNQQQYQYGEDFEITIREVKYGSNRQYIAYDVEFDKRSTSIYLLDLTDMQIHEVDGSFIIPQFGAYQVESNTDNGIIINDVQMYISSDELRRYYYDDGTYYDVQNPSYRLYVDLRTGVNDSITSTSLPNVCQLTNIHQ